MKSERKVKIIAIVGPTASGKSDLAVALALRLNSPRLDSGQAGQAEKIFAYGGAEIISADSRQVYRGLDIGTGKVPLTKRREKLFYKGIRHHLIDAIPPMRQFTVAQYQKLARRAIDDIMKRGKIPILCGGTGLYFDAVLYDLPIPSVKPSKALRKKLEKLSAETLFEILKMKDPTRARTIDRFNKRRVIRALEIIETTGASVPPLDAYYAHPRYEILKIGIKIAPEKLKQNIHKRLLARLRPSTKLGVNQGMIREVEQLLTKKQITKKRLEELGLEYRHIGRYLNGDLTQTEMKKALEKEIERFAKRQMTWLKRDPNMIWTRNLREAELAVSNFIHGDS